MIIGIGYFDTVQLFLFKQFFMYRPHHRRTAWIVVRWKIRVVPEDKGTLPVGNRNGLQRGGGFDLLFGALAVIVASIINQQFIGIVNKHGIDMARWYTAGDFCTGDHQHIVIFGFFGGNLVGAITIRVWDICRMGLVFQMLGGGIGRQAFAGSLFDAEGGPDFTVGKHGVGMQIYRQYFTAIAGVGEVEFRGDFSG